MKLKIELNLTPQEAQELFIPGEKQAEFVAALAKAYTEALAGAALSALGGIANKVTGGSEE